MLKKPKEKINNGINQSQILSHSASQILRTTPPDQSQQQSFVELQVTTIDKQKYTFNFDKQQLQNEGYSFIDSFKDQQNRIVKDKYGYGIRAVYNSQLKLQFSPNVQICDQVSKQNQNTQSLFIIIADKKIDNMRKLSELDINIRNKSEFIFSLLYYLNQEIERKQINNCKFSFLENIYYKYEDQNYEFSFFFTELYVKSIMSKDQISKGMVFSYVVYLLSTNRQPSQYIQSFFDVSFIQDQKVQRFLVDCQSSNVDDDILNNYIKSIYSENLIQKNIKFDQIDSLIDKMIIDN